MRPSTCMLLTSTLSTATFLASTATGADLSKEGTFSGTYSGFGTVRVSAIGKVRVLAAFDENGLTLTNGLLDHMTWHCWGTEDFTNGMGQGQGYCVGTDPAGDQIVHNFGPDEKHAPDQKSWNSPFSLTTGTGRYAGINGGGTFVLHVNEFRPATEGTFLNYVTIQGSYKLP
jgi:hypothetical protein